jgi:hypothetical protein
MTTKAHPFGMESPMKNLKKPAFIESMTLIKTSTDVRIRIWSEIPAVDASRVEFVQAILNDFSERFKPEDITSPGELALAISSIHPDITAVEVTDPDGNGTVVYTQWP